MRKILFLTAGPDIVASSRTRVYQFVPYLEKAGFQCRIIPYESKRSCWENLNHAKKSIFSKVLNKLYSYLQILRFISLASRYDILFIQRVLIPIGLQKFIRRINDNIFFDFDDALYLNPGKKFVRRLDNLIKESKAVFLENEFTKEYSSRLNKNIFVITGPIEVNRYLPDTRGGAKSKVVIGWIGSFGTAEFIKPLKEVFRGLSNKYENIEIDLIGAPDLDLGLRNVVTKTWRLETEVPDLQYFDIGIMPLLDNDWSRGKGGYKLLQYMSIGIPSVASAIGINAEIVKDGVSGFLVNNGSEWMDRLSKLIENPELRRSMGAEARKIAVERYSYEAYVPALTAALKGRSGS